MGDLKTLAGCGRELASRMRRAKEYQEELTYFTVWATERIAQCLRPNPRFLRPMRVDPLVEQIRLDPRLSEPPPGYGRTFSDFWESPQLNPFERRPLNPNQIFYVSPDGGLQLTLGELRNMGQPMFDEDWIELLITCPPMHDAHRMGLAGGTSNTVGHLLEWLVKNTRSNQPDYTAACIDMYFVGLGVEEGVLAMRGSWVDPVATPPGPASGLTPAQLAAFNAGGGMLTDANAQLFAADQMAKAMPSPAMLMKTATEKQSTYDPTLTADQLRQIMPNAGNNADLYVNHLNSAMAEFNINTPQRQSMFLGQVAWESDQLNAVTENLNYSAKGLMSTFPRHFTKDSAVVYAHKPEAIANRAYANRMGNGNEVSGDGWCFRGRGLFQTTGRANYVATGNNLDVDLERNPDLLATDPHLASRSAAYYFATNGGNELADANDFSGVTRMINGSSSTTYLREPFYNSALGILNNHNVVKPISKPLDLPSNRIDYFPKARR